MRLQLLRLMALAAFILFAGQALADTWNVTRLRGQVLQLVEGKWQPLARGGSVPDERVVRTMANGHVSLVRGKETVELGPNTQVRIFDEGGKKPFTVVQQDFGTVAVEAEVRNVQHFAVKNQYLAAVVKGTRFTVTAGKSSASVAVERGQVAVESSQDHSNTLIVAGQQAKVQKGKGLSVAGKGTLPAILKKGAKAVSLEAKVAQALADLKAAQASGDAEAIAEAQQVLAEVAQDTAKLAKDALKGDDKAAARAAADAAKGAKKAADEAQKAAEKAAKNSEKAQEEADKAAAKAAEDARKTAEKAAKDAEKAAKDEGTGKTDPGANSANSGPNNDQSENNGKSDDKEKSGDKPKKAPK